MIRFRFLTTISAVTIRATLAWLLLVLSAPCAEAQPSVKQALSLVPMQADVEIDRPADDQALEGYEVVAENTESRRAWVVRGPNGLLLRRFSDTNGDNKIDQWCYFRGGVEVYRDIDGDFNEKADQYRWFGTGGLRWGLDKDEDGVIDDWRWISPEEVSSQLVRAVSRRDATLFQTLLIQDEELEQLGLTERLKSQLREQVAAAKQRFTTFSSEQTQVAPQSVWVDFSAPTPGVLPAGGEHGEQDIIVYENVIAMVETDGQHAELPIGTLIKVDQRWRMIGLPDSSLTGFFYRAADRETLPVANVSSEANEKLQQLVASLEKIDQQLASSTTAAPASVHAQRGVILRQLAEASSGNERDMWLGQLIDSVISSSQTQDGVQRLERLVETVEAATSNKEVIGQAKFAFLTARYSESLQASGADLAAIQDQWIKDLETFVTQFEKSRPAAEAMLQLAISEEFAGKEQEAVDWYRQIVSSFPESDLAAKAEGAVRRLNSVGAALPLKGKTLDGRALDLAKLKGNLVLVHYWATWCEPCKQDIELMRKLVGKYARKKFVVLGVNLDDSSGSARQFAKQVNMSWPSLHSDGGLESELAREMGVFTLPLMLLVDESGKVINRSITLAELESQLEKRR